jgi:signal transduction histidine kinase
VASLSWIIVALVSTAGLLVYFDWDHITRNYDANIRMHLEEMADQSPLGRSEALEGIPHPTDRRFDIPRSGWYWEVRRDGRVLARSASLEDQGLGPNRPEPGIVHKATGPWGKRIRLQALERAAAPGETPLYFLATASVVDIRAEAIDIAEHTAISFLVLTAVLVAAAVVQLRIALRPLHAVGDAVGLVRDGRATTLEGSFPREVRPLVDQLNALIEHSAVLASRARNRLGDLAHSIKNPLTALNSEAYEHMEEPQRTRVLEQTRHIQDSLEHYLARARVFGSDKVLGALTPVKPLIEDLAFLMRRVYADRELNFDTGGLGGCCFRGEAQDLEESVGNLLDNAGKWASSEVRVHCNTRDRRLHITVEDDGPGIPQDQVPRILKGVRLNSDKPGRGRGLGITRDIVEMYGGELKLSASELGGLRAEVQLPGTWASC